MSGYLLDTSVLLRYLDEPEGLSEGAKAVLGASEARILVSAASFFEIAVKKALKKARVPDNLPEIVAKTGLEILPIQPEHSWKTLRLPYHHTDPYDRLLLAQASCHGLTIITACPHFDAYNVPLLKA
jgi:PIN domain nuclease of toxin-antitoxin system